MEITILKIFTYASLTIAAFLGARWLYSRTHLLILNPVFVSIAIIIAVLKLFGITYEEYAIGGKWVEFWLGPAIVALGVPLYTHLKTIRRFWLPILCSQLAGCVVGIVSVVAVARLLGASKAVIISLAPKSVSTAIAVSISGQLGGIPALTAAIVLIVGIVGGICGMKLLSLCHLKSPVGRSLGIGAASHLMGTEQISVYGERYRVYSTIALTINGILTAILTAPILEMML